MKKNGIFKLLILVLMSVVIIGIAKSSFAVSTITAIENSTGNGTNNTINNISTNEPVNNIPVNNVVQNVPVNNTVIPQTGAKSATGLFVIMGILGLSAVYTFVKIKKYEI